MDKNELDGTIIYCGTKLNSSREFLRGDKYVRNGRTIKAKPHDLIKKRYATKYFQETNLKKMVITSYKESNPGDSDRYIRIDIIKNFTADSQKSLPLIKEILERNSLGTVRDEFTVSNMNTLNDALWKNDTTEALNCISKYPKIIINNKKKLGRFLLNPKNSADASKLFKLLVVEKKSMRISTTPKRKSI